MKNLFLFLISFLLFGHCTNSEIKKTMTTAFENPFGGNGSTLRLYTCGYPIHSKFKTKSIQINLTPTSGSKSGSGYADILLEPESFQCKARLFFTYFQGQMGGHSGGESFISFGIFERENPVSVEISQSPKAKPIQMGETIEAELSANDDKLPDGSYVHYYVLDLNKADNGIKIDFKSTEGFLEGAMYKNGTFLELPIGSGIRLKQGKVYFLFTAGEQKRKYNFIVEKLSEKEFSILKEPKL